ncbi:MAG: hypothetical protein WBZ11_16485 [Candidatus Sulfotelmatobacter sp.]
MQANVQERRLMRRFDMRLPAIVRLEAAADSRDPEQNLSDLSPPEPVGSEPAREFQTETQNVSARGVYLYLDRAVPAGTRCEVILTFPPHITLTDAVRVRFTARVIRSEAPLPSAKVGTAAMIEDYEFLRSGGNGDFLSALQKNWKDAN